MKIENSTHPKLKLSKETLTNLTLKTGLRAGVKADTCSNGCAETTDKCNTGSAC